MTAPIRSEPVDIAALEATIEALSGHYDLATWARHMGRVLRMLPAIVAALREKAAG